jgi:5-methylthioadenosine/S-adenosylhomocysteine deaminase
VAVDGDRIAYVGPAADGPPGTVHALGDAIVLPGLVNAHAHLELTDLAGRIPGGTPFLAWIQRVVTFQRTELTPTARARAAGRGAALAVAAGTTTIADTTDTGIAGAAIAAAGLRGVVYLEVFGPDPADADRAVADLGARVAAWRRDLPPRVAVGVSPHAPYTVSDALYRAVGAFARTEELPVACHIAEGADESALVASGAGPWADALRARGIAVAPRARTPIALLDAHGLLGPRTLAIHAVHCDAADRARLAATGTPVAHCPEANAALGHGDAPLAAWLDAGIAVGLGTDSLLCTARMHVLLQARIARERQAAHGRRVTARDLVAMATIGGALALGLDAEVGTLAPGKRADLAVFPLVGHGADPYEAVLAAAGDDARCTVVDGRVVHGAGTFPG